MLSINTNLSSIIAQNSMTQSTNALNQAIERMTTGFKINHAKDNAANYSISTNMTTKLGAYQIAEENAAMGLDMVTSASSTLDLVTEHVQRIRDLCEQASNGTYGEESLKAIQSEIDARQQEVDRILSQAEYNGIKMLEGTEPTGGGVTGKYILMNDIDLAGYDWEPVGASDNRFYGELNGNGYVIRNLSINSDKDFVGLFAYLNEATVSNLGIENANIKSTSTHHVLVGILTGGYDRYDGAFFENCYVTGSINTVSTDRWSSIGGLMGECSTGQGGDIINCYTNVTINSNYGRVGSFCGSESDAGFGNITNSYYVDNLPSISAIGGGSSGHGETNVTMTMLNALIIPPTALAGDKTISLQIGTMGDSNSQISFVSSVALESLAINCLDSNSARNSLTTIDDYLAKISAKQTEYGAIQNRLESALEEIIVQYDNLVSSRSTLRDADIAEVSSHYIQQQILQQASATLMATANQSPSIALQLI